MIQGVVTQDGIPVIEIEVNGQIWNAIVDTGFTGDLELPEELRAGDDPDFVGRVTALLASSQEIEEDVYLVDFPFDGRIVRAQATFARGDSVLIGTGMLCDFRLGIDFPAGTLVIENA